MLELWKRNLGVWARGTSSMLHRVDSTKVAGLGDGKIGSLRGFVLGTICVATLGCYNSIQGRQQNPPHHGTFLGSQEHTRMHVQGKCRENPQQ